MLKNQNICYLVQIAFSELIISIDIYVVTKITQTKSDLTWEGHIILWKQLTCLNLLNWHSLMKIHKFPIIFFSIWLRISLILENILENTIFWLQWEYSQLYYNWIYFVYIYCDTPGSMLGQFDSRQVHKN